MNSFNINSTHIVFSLTEEKKFGGRSKKQAKAKSKTKTK
jgi:hypothetical protein